MMRITVVLIFKSRGEDFVVGLEDVLAVFYLYFVGGILVDALDAELIHPLLIIKQFVNLGAALANLFSLLGQHHSHFLLPLLLTLLGGTEHLHELLMLSPFLRGKSPCCCFHNRIFLYLSAAKLRFSENKTKKFFLFLPSVSNFALFLQRKDTHYSPILQSLEEKYPFVSVCQRTLEPNAEPCLHELC